MTWEGLEAGKTSLTKGENLTNRLSNQGTRSLTGWLND